MKKAMPFMKALAQKAKEDRVLSMANEVTYKSLLALFPFLIFLLTLLGFINIDGEVLLAEVLPYLPEQVGAVFATFVYEVIDTRSPGLLSASLLTAILSASSGFKSVIRCVNRAHNVAKQRSFIKITCISIALVFIFAFIAVLSFVVLIFSDIILAAFDWVWVAAMPNVIWRSFELFSAFLVFFVVFGAVIIIYKAALNSGVTRRVWPGALATAILWQASSAVFNVYVNNFSRFSIVYGSIGSLFVSLIWLNMILFILLMGSELNAVLENRNADARGSTRINTDSSPIDTDSD